MVLRFTLNISEPIAAVKSDSMSPYIRKGDIVIIKGIKNDTIIKTGTIENKKGDVIVFDAHGLWKDAPDDPIVHRVVGICENESKVYYITKGDANTIVDKTPIPKDRIIGIVKEVIRYIGWSKLILMEISFSIQVIFFSLLMFYLINKFRMIKF